MSTFVADEEVQPAAFDEAVGAFVPEPCEPMPQTWRRGALVGGALATVLFAYVLFIGKVELTAAPSGNFYDLQARAWFDGQWDIPEVDVKAQTVPPVPEQASTSPLSIEAIVIDGKEFLYYGPVPSLLRVPILAASDDFDGETTQPYMLAAFVLALAGLVRLQWRIRWLVRGEARLAGGEPLLAGAVTFVLGAGSVLLYLGSQPTVYHEATLWGIAFALWAYAAVLDLQLKPSVAGAVWAGVWTLLALLCRATVGAGPLFALGLLFLVFVWRARAHRRSTSANRTGSDDTAGRVAVAMLLAGIVCVVSYAGINMVKFGEPFRLPLEKQVFSTFDPNRIAALEDNNGSLFGLKFLPTTVFQYARPDAIEVDQLAPWLNFPREQATVVGDVTFDTRDEASSLPATMPLWTVSAAIGAVALARDLLRREHRLRPLLIPVVGAAAGCVGVLTIAFIANRYLGDLFPLIALLAIAGVHVLVGWWRDAHPTRLLAIPLVLLGLWSVAANLGLALEYQRLIAPVEESTRDAFVAWQYELYEGSYRIEDRSDARTLGDLDAPAPRGTIAVVSPWWCEWSDGFGWHQLGIPIVEAASNDDAGSQDRTENPLDPRALMCAELASRLGELRNPPGF